MFIFKRKFYEAGRVFCLKKAKVGPAGDKKTDICPRQTVQRTEGHTNTPINMGLGKIGHGQANLILFSAHLVLVMHRSNILDVHKVF